MTAVGKPRLLTGGIMAATLPARLVFMAVMYVIDRITTSGTANAAQAIAEEEGARRHEDVMARTLGERRSQEGAWLVGTVQRETAKVKVSVYS